MLTPKLTKEPERKTPDEELAESQRTHTIKKSCKYCYGRGHVGTLATGPEKGRYVRCRCAKAKTAEEISSAGQEKEKE